MLEVNGFDHINLNVLNLERSLSFYKEVFGMDIREEGLNKGLPYAIIGNGRAFFALYESKDVKIPSSLNHIGIHIENFQGAFEKLKEVNVELDYDYIIEYQNSRSIYVKDPDGYSYELSEKFGGDL